MSLAQKVAVGLVVTGAIMAKTYVFLRPVGWFSIILGTILLIFTEPAEAR